MKLHGSQGSDCIGHKTRKQCTLQHTEMHDSCIDSVEVPVDDVATDTYMHMSTACGIS